MASAVVVKARVAAAAVDVAAVAVVDPVVAAVMAKAVVAADVAVVALAATAPLHPGLRRVVEAANFASRREFYPGQSL